MSALAIIAALLLEQWHPLGGRKASSAMLARWAIWIERTFNAGQERHGVLAWCAAVLPIAVGAALLDYALGRASPLLGLAFDVAVLYLTLGFRQSSHYFTGIQLALKEGDLDRARELISAWRGEATVERSAEEVARLAIEEALLASHRQVYAVLLWYVLLPGPSGALLYRLAHFLYRRWHALGAFGRFADRAFLALDWPAVRLTAAAFAVVGDFEDAASCWRLQARSWPDTSAGIVLAAGAGALGVRLGMDCQGERGRVTRPELGVGEAGADAAVLDRTVGLLWRALVCWVFLLILVSFGRALG